MAYTIRINGRAHVAEVDGDTPLLWVLRDVLHMKGTKFGCGAGLCGACTVLLDGNATRSCITPVEVVGDMSITTIEGASDTAVGQAVQKAWLELDVVQCGYCQSGQIMAACGLLNATPQPTDDDITNHMAGNLCRCGTYIRIHAAVRQASRTIPIKKVA